jgi:cell division protein FtsL
VPANVHNDLPPFDEATFDSFADLSREATARNGVDTVPIDEARAPRSRNRRGGPRTPLPLLPLIAVCAGVGIAYVAQTAHLTQVNYQATTLQAQQNELHREEARLADQVERLRSSARIGAAAQQLGLRPPARWAYVPSVTTPVVVPASPGPARPGESGDTVQRLVAALSGVFGPAGAEAAGP